MATLPRAWTRALLVAAVFSAAVCAFAGRAPAPAAGPAGLAGYMGSRRSAPDAPPPEERGAVCVYAEPRGAYSWPMTSFCRRACEHGEVTGVAPDMVSPAEPCTSLAPEPLRCSGTESLE